MKFELAVLLLYSPFILMQTITHYVCMAIRMAYLLAWWIFINEVSHFSTKNKRIRIKTYSYVLSKKLYFLPRKCGIIVLTQKCFISTLLTFLSFLLCPVRIGSTIVLYCF